MWYDGVYEDCSAFRDMTVTCPDCGWSGLGQETTFGDQGANASIRAYFCPKCTTAEQGLPKIPVIAEWRDGVWLLQFHCAYCDRVHGARGRQ